jgi:hypothetical protein
MENRKARTHKGRKILEQRRGLINEGPKVKILIRGNKTNENVTGCMKDLVNTFLITNRLNGVAQIGRILWGESMI